MSRNPKIKFGIKNKVLDEFLVDMKQKDMFNNTMSRIDQLQSQIDALFKAIGGLVTASTTIYWAWLP